MPSEPLIGTSFTLTPTSLREAFHFFVGVADYSVLDIFRRKPITVRSDEILSYTHQIYGPVLFDRARPRSQYILVFRRGVKNHIAMLDPRDFLSHLPLQKKTLRDLWITNFRKDALIALKHSVTTHYIFGLALFIWTLGVARNWLLKQPASTGLLVSETCSVSCAQQLIHIHTVVLLFCGMPFFGALIAIFSYRFARKRARDARIHKAAWMEATLVLLVCAQIAYFVAGKFSFSQYAAVVKRTWHALQL